MPSRLPTLQSLSPMKDTHAKAIAALRFVDFSLAESGYVPDSACRSQIREALDAEALAPFPSLVIPVYVRSVYGNEHVYAADETQARFLSALTSSKTLTDSHRRALEGLGFSFSLVTDPRLMGSPLGATLFALGASAVNVPSNPQA